ncbi:hypothetical protein ES705_41256 [subsurface metagenome]
MFIGCRGNPEIKSEESDNVILDSARKYVDAKKDSIKEVRKKKAEIIYGDTVWVQSYASTLWHDSIFKDDYQVFLSVWVDTTDHIVDTVVSSKGRRIVIGYNHHYNLNFRKHNKYRFSLNFNKKRDLEKLLISTDSWLESNLDVFQKLYYNKKYNKFIVDFDINPRYDYGAIYYFVFNTEGIIEYKGMAGSWGGGDPDGEAFLSGDNELFVTSYEVYNFRYEKSLSIKEFTSLLMSGGSTNDHLNYKNLHALRELSDNTFLLVFNRFGKTPEYNAIVLRNDTTVLGRFKYYGLMEETDAILLFTCHDQLKEYYLYDTERETLISISTEDKFRLCERSIGEMVEISSDTLREDHSLYHIDFEVFGSYRFFLTPENTAIYYEIDKLE